MTEHQQCQQCEGPARPAVADLARMLTRIPSHHAIVAVSVNGQAGVVVIETRHEELNKTDVFILKPEGWAS